jgi:Rrf2 family protein
MIEVFLNQPSSSLLKLPAKVKYALLLLLALTDRSTRQASLTANELIAQYPIPECYLEQILASLRHSGLVKSRQGARGGYQLAREPEQITLLDVLVSVEGEQHAAKRHEERTLDREIIHSIWQQARAASQTVLQQQTLQDLCQRRHEYRQQTVPDILQVAVKEVY